MSALYPCCQFRSVQSLMRAQMTPRTTEQRLGSCDAATALRAMTEGGSSGCAAVDVAAAMRARRAVTTVAGPGSGVGVATAVTLIAACERASRALTAESVLPAMPRSVPRAFGPRSKIGSNWRGRRGGGGGVCEVKRPSASAASTHPSREHAADALQDRVVARGRPEQGGRAGGGRTEAAPAADRGRRASTAHNALSAAAP